MDDRANSRTSSKRRSKRMNDDRRSNRSYTSRRDHERGSYRNEEKREDDKPKGRSLLHLFQVLIGGAKIQV
ncbi:ALI_HP2_G0016850.mRNA.1.CDS.1 [Saccharomyces cerevisiae]|nr:ALI_HP2_G0016850.mRNA.1.CDS.1 [Saccharomyces cerevisiae]CAI6487610.1 ALI_HP2_G0016850.mRNA.1.CDS.1 [Saccharomyces cerevisiae]